MSSVAKREQLEAAIDYLRDGDVFVVTKLDRLARSTRDLLQIVERIQQQGSILNVLSMKLNTATATGKLMLDVLCFVAQFERAMMLGRQRDGIEKARQAGKYKGRQPTARAKSKEVLRRLKAGEKPTQVAKDVRIARPSVCRIMDDARSNPAKSAGNHAA